MRYSLLSEHRERLHCTGSVEFEDLLTPEECDLLLEEAEEATLGATSPMGRAERGFDLWRRRANLARIVRRVRYAEIAAELFRTSPLRLAFDQLLVPKTFVSQAPLTLEQFSPISGMAGGVVLALTDPIEGRSDFPSKRGSGLFLLPTHPMLLNVPADGLLIAYCGDRSLYAYNPSAPHLHLLKRLGYVFGDRLREETHPTLLRRIR